MTTLFDEEYNEDYDEDEPIFPQGEATLNEIERDLIAIMGARELGQMSEDAYQTAKFYMEKYQTILEG